MKSKPPAWVFGILFVLIAAAAKSHGFPIISKISVVLLAVSIIAEALMNDEVGLAAVTFFGGIAYLAFF